MHGQKTPLNFKKMYLVSSQKWNDFLSWKKNDSMTINNTPDDQDFNSSTNIRVDHTQNTSVDKINIGIKNSDTKPKKSQKTPEMSSLPNISKNDFKSCECDILEDSLNKNKTKTKNQKGTYQFDSTDNENCDPILLPEEVCEPILLPEGTSQPGSTEKENCDPILLPDEVINGEPILLPNEEIPSNQVGRKRKISVNQNDIQNDNSKKMKFVQDKIKNNNIKSGINKNVKAKNSIVNRTVKSTSNTPKTCKSSLDLPSSHKTATRKRKLTPNNNVFNRKNPKRTKLIKDSESKKRPRDNCLDDRILPKEKRRKIFKPVISQMKWVSL